MDNNPKLLSREQQIRFERVSWGPSVRAFLQKLNQKFGVQAGRFQLPDGIPDAASRKYDEDRFGDDDTVSGQERAIFAGKTAHIGPFIVETQLGVYAWYNANSGGKPTTG